MKAVVMVIDSFGIGAMPDAFKYGDEGSNTALHICEKIKGEKWSNLKKMGLGNAASLLGFDLPGCLSAEKPIASYGIMAEASEGKDTSTGHWEIAGIILKKPFVIFPANYPSFPEDLVKEFEDKIGRKIIGNKAASGTVIIQELGQEHIETGALIAYTSADSVLQIAAHEEQVPLKALYEICEKTRKICDKYNIARVIARPFVGSPGNFVRTGNRRDFSIDLPEKTILDYLKESGIKTIAVGKIGDIFNESGIIESHHDKGNDACLNRTLEILKNEKDDCFMFINLVDTDMHYGHRRNIQGYYEAVSKIDMTIPKILDLLDEEDLLIITADHGCDPSFKGSDHTREYVPVLCYRKNKEVINLGKRKTFSDISQTLGSFFSIKKMKNGKTFF